MVPTFERLFLDNERAAERVVFRTVHECKLGYCVGLQLSHTRQLGPPPPINKQPYFSLTLQCWMKKPKRRCPCMMDASHCS